jgi:hypothetical protein
VGLQASLAAQRLGQLGHVEFDWRARNAAAAVETICSIPTLDGIYLLTGARPLDLVERLEQLASEGYDISFHPAQHQNGIAPSTVFAEGEQAEMLRFSKAAGVRFELLAGPRLASVLPPLRLDRLADRAQPDRRFPYAPVEHETMRPRWNASERPTSDGLWLFGSHARQHTYYLCVNSEWWHIPTHEYAAYLARALLGEQRPVIAYDAIDRHLLVSRRAPLPPLQARAAALCSGRAPRVARNGDGELDDVYVNVDAKTADAIVCSLRARP